MKTQELIHTTRVKQAPERAAESDKSVGNGKRMNTRKQWTHMEVEHAHGSGTTYLYPANTWEVGHGSKVREGVVCSSSFGGSLFWGFHLSSFEGNVLLG